MRNAIYRWIAVLAPIFFFLFLEFAGYVWRPGLTSRIGKIWVDLIVLAAALLLSITIWAVIQRTTQRLERQNRELLALHAAGLDVAAELSLDAVLQKVVDAARVLVEARYGALSVIDERGRIIKFITSGVSDSVRAAIGEPPKGRGLLGVPLFEGERLRTAHIGADSRSVGFPDNHPPMESLLAVPVRGSGPFRGNLYLSEKEDQSTFSSDDEETLARFATQAAIAINNASLHRQVSDLAIAQERERIAHEMHDGLAQILGYVNTKAQAARGFLQSGNRERAEAQLDELAVAARDVYTDVREAIMGLRTLPERKETFRELIEEYVEEWTGHSGIDVQLAVAIPPRLSSKLELQLIRIIQESLANVRKHSGATRVSIRLEEREGALLLEIEDDGIGFSAMLRQRGDLPRFGLSTMRERAASVGGTLEVATTGTGRGTVVRFTGPL